jgi:hypothetical protein
MQWGYSGTAKVGNGPGTKCFFEDWSILSQIVGLLIQEREPTMGIYLLAFSCYVSSVFLS